METELQAARYLLYVAAVKVTANAPDKTKFAAMAKRLATDTGSSVVDRALQLHGGYGYLQDYPIERFWRDLRVHSILEGTNQIMRVIVSRDLLSAVTDDVLISVEGGVGRIRLNRPKAIHALTTGMCEAMSEALLNWRADPAVEAVIIDHAEGRGFCAGGDVVMLARSGDDRCGGGEALLLRRISAQPSAVHLPQADDRDHGRDHDGRRRRHFAALRLSRRDREHAARHAGNGDRPVPRRRRRLVSVAAARPRRPVHGADRRPARWRANATLSTSPPITSSSRSLRRCVERDPESARPRCRARFGAASMTPPEARIEANLPQIAQLFASDRLEDMLAALEADESDWARTELATLADQEPAVLQGLAAPARRRRDARELRRRDAGRICARGAASFAPTTSAKACARC